MNRTAPDSLPAGTRVIHADDGEPGTILSGVTPSAGGGWAEYEVETAYGIERWEARKIVRIDEPGAE